MLQHYDAMVGDTTIIANRSEYIDFTLPYTESGVQMIVPMKDSRSKSFWLFLKPLTSDLWLAILTLFVFTGFVVWLIEHRVENSELRADSYAQQLFNVSYFNFFTLRTAPSIYI